MERVYYVTTKNKVHQIKAFSMAGALMKCSQNGWTHFTITARH